MQKIVALIVVFIMVLTVATGCTKRRNTGGDNSSSSSQNSLGTSSVGDLSSSGDNSSSQGGGTSSTEPEPVEPEPVLSTFERISAMDGNIFSLDFEDETTVTPLYTDNKTPGKWDETTKKGLYQNFSTKNNEGSPQTNYVEVSDGVAKLIDTSNGGTKMIIDFGDKDIDSGAIEGYFEFTMVDVGPSWTPFQFFGVDKNVVGSEIFGIRTTTALSNGDIQAGIRIDKESDTTIKNPNIIFANGYTYYIHFDFNIVYGRFVFTIDCLDQPYGEKYVYSVDMEVASVQGLCVSTSDSGTRCGNLDNFALSYYDGNQLFMDELKAYADKYAVYARGDEQILNSVEDILKEFNSVIFTQTEVTEKKLLEQYKQKIYDVYANSSEIFAINATMTEFIDYFLGSTPSYRPSWASEGFKNRWNYIDGVFLEGLVQNYERTGDESYKDFFIRFINYYIYEEGKNVNAKFRNPESSMFSTAYNGSELDSVCESRILFDAYEYTGDKRYLEAIDYTYNTLKKSVPMAGNSGCYSHKESYKNQIWLDGFYMYAPFTIRYANLYDNDELRAELANQYRYVYENMRDENGLYRHGIDVTKTQSWADKQTGLSQSVWLRAEGWLLASLVDCIEYFPQGEDRAFLEKMFAEAMAGVVAFRDEATGMYYNVVDLDPTVEVKKGKETVYNYLETSGSALVAYACMKGARLGVLDEEYLSLGAGTFEGIYENKLTKQGNSYVLKDIVLSAGLGGSRDGTPYYYLTENMCENDGKGVGPFLMAYNEFSLYKTK